MKMREIHIPGDITTAMLREIYEGTGILVLDYHQLEPRLRFAADCVTGSITNGTQAYYAMTTGVGKLASIRIAAGDAEKLQRNLILSHCCGVGSPLPDEIVRLAMSLKIISLSQGASGVRPEVVKLLVTMLNKNILPIIPEKGSVGASGDLAPLSHMVAAMMGEGVVKIEGSQTVPATKALQAIGMLPLTLKAKEGVALINGTQVSTAIALAGLFRAHRGLVSSVISGALSTDAAMGSTSPFHPEIHTLRGHKSQIDVAFALYALLEGSEIRASHLTGDERIQDPYCLRCQPQIVGACLGLLRQASDTLRVEATGVTDNPLVLSDGTIISGGNFHAEPVAFAADQIAMAVCEIGAVAQRRVALLMDPSLSYGLPAFLTPEPGVHSGFMTAEVTTAALMSENKQMSHPASVGSTPTSANQEDHVSMACHGARRLLPMADNLFNIIGIEALVATQGIDFREPLKTGDCLKSAYRLIREAVPRLVEDRYMADDLATAANVVSSGSLAMSIEATVRDRLEI
ncbi:hypothetical protein E8E14_008399 [Neopestalotiopsis sp. 37M]|nr:hypothetical protein E8E14_008399 [Neopestalotiopsis sp. 37M]